MNLLFLKIAFRYLVKHKLYSFINIFGLAVGFASFILILMYSNYEYSYDKFNGSENIYRAYMDYTEGGEYVPGDAQTYNLTGPTLKETFPEVLDYVRIFRLEKVSIISNENIYEEFNGGIADPSYFNLLDRQLIKGDINTILREPNTIVLSEKLANKLFGEQDPIGKTIDLYWDEKVNLKVEGIVETFLPIHI
jgi:putative ABC transport system permease protein